MQIELQKTTMYVDTRAPNFCCCYPFAACCFYVLIRVCMFI